MKRYHVLSIAFLAGLISGVSVPSHVMAASVQRSTEAVTIDSVDSDNCSFDTDSGDTFYFDDCDDEELIKSGDSATLLITDYTKTLITEDDQSIDIE